MKSARILLNKTARLGSRLSIFFLFAAPGCQQPNTAESNDLQITDTTRIVSLTGTFTEIICALGYENQVVGTDITSTYPATMKALPKLGYNKGIPAEGVLSLNPDIILARKGELKEGFEMQIAQAGRKLLVFDQEFSIEGTRALIRAISDTLGLKEKGEQLIAKMESGPTLPARIPSQPKVLFVYARGQGALSVAGTNTPYHAMIELAGAQNAVTQFEGFKTLTAESLIEVNPDVVLFFDDGLAGLGGVEGALGIPGMANTNAGKNKAIISMDGILLAGFGPRLMAAINELNGKILLHTAND